MEIFLSKEKSERRYQSSGLRDKGRQRVRDRDDL